MKRNQNPNHGSAKFSRLRLTSKKNENSSRDSGKQTEKISKYFSSKTQCVSKPQEPLDDLQDIECCSKPVDIAESPYKNSLSEINAVINDSINDEKDFKTPKPVKRGVKLFDIKSTYSKHVEKPKRKQVKTNKSRKPSKKVGIQRTITRMVENNFQSNDTNGEHLQMAIALSKSVQDVEKQDMDMEEDLSSVYDSTQQRVSSFRRTLEQFGFTSDNQNTHRGIKINSNDAGKRRKKSKYQYITPVLFLRTQEDRDAIIATKISLILSQNRTEPYPDDNKEEQILHSDILQELRMSNLPWFNLSKLECTEVMTEDTFYCKKFNVPRCTLKCGSLLKRWENIPGREVTPPRQLTSNDDTLKLTNDLSKLSGFTKSNNDIESIDMKLNISRRPVEISHFQISKLNDFPKLSADNPKSCDVVMLTQESSNEIADTEKQKCINSPIMLVQPSDKNNIFNIETTSSENETVQSSLNSINSQRSVSPDLFGTDDEDSAIEYLNRSIDDNIRTCLDIINNIKTKNSSMDSSSNSVNSNKTSCKQLYITETKIVNKSCSNHETDVSLDDVACRSELQITPTKLNLIQRNFAGKRNLDVCSASMLSNFETLNASKSSNEIINISRKSSDFSDYEMYKSEKGICHYESFTANIKDMTHEYYDLTQSSDESNSNMSTPENARDIENCTPDNIRKESTDTLYNSTKNNCEQSNTFMPELMHVSSSITFHESEQHKVSDVYEDRLVEDEPVKENDSYSFNGSLNVTEYVNNLLKEKTFNDTPEDIHDLTQSSDECRVHNGKEPYLQNNSPKSSFSKKTNCINSSKTNIYKISDESNVAEECEAGYVKSNGQLKDINSSHIECNSNMLETSVPMLSNSDSVENKFTSKALIKCGMNISSSNSVPFDGLGTNKVLSSVSSTTTDLSIEQKSSVLENSINYDKEKFSKHSSFSSVNSEDNPSCSQNSIYVSDEELNYSSIFSTPQNKKTNINQNKINKYVICELSSSEDDTDNHKKSEKMCDKKNLILEFDLSIDNIIYKENKHVDIDNFVSDLNNYIKHNSDTEDKNESKIDHNKVNSYDYFENYMDCDYDNHDILEQETPDASKPLKVSRVSSILKHPRILALNTPERLSSNKLENHNNFEDSFDKLLEKSDILVDIENPRPGTSKDVKMDNENVSEQNTKFVISDSKANLAATPDGAFVIKTTDVTPMPDYDNMNTPIIFKELEKFGLKNLKRHRGVQVLKYIYESTHPVVGPKDLEDSSEEDGKVVKRHKRNSGSKSRKNLEIECYNASPQKTFTNKDNEPLNYDKESYSVSGNIEIVGDLLSQNEMVEDLIFERKQSTKIPSCRVPLHIAWHNLVTSHPELRENILLYEPLQLEVLYSMLKEEGFKYNIQDLLTFLDKKCITIRTNQGQGQNRNRRKTKT